MTSDEAFCRSLGNGHSLAVLVPKIVDLDKDDGAPLPERFSDLATQLAQKHTLEEVRRIVRSLMGVGFNLNLFPNLALSMAFFRVLRPISAEETEIRHVAWRWTAVRKKPIACGCAFTNTSRVLSVSAARTMPKHGNACSGVRMPALTYHPREPRPQPRNYRAERRKDRPCHRRDRHARGIQAMARNDGANMIDNDNALYSDQTFARAIDFIWREAELLDSHDYRAWLKILGPKRHLRGADRS